MADLSRIKHLFFDLDDTLWDYETNSRVVLEELFGVYGFANKLNSGFDDFYSIYKKVNLELWSLFYKRMIDKDGLRETRWIRVFDHFKYQGKENHPELTRFYTDRAPKGTCLKDGCIDTLEHLRKKYTLHIITNGFKEIQHIKIDGCGLRSYFENIIISEEHGLVKPEEQIFRYAETLAGCRPDEAMMIGDSLESDVQGAINAGWGAIYYSADPGEYQGIVISKLQELKEIFR